MIDIELAKSWHKIFASQLAYAMSGIEPFAGTPEEIGNHQRCQLGQWLSSQFDRYSSSASFLTLLAQHQRFHQHAAAMVRKHQAGENESARAIQYKMFDQTSKETLQALELFAKATSITGYAKRFSSILINMIGTWRPSAVCNDDELCNKVNP